MKKRSFLSSILFCFLTISINAQEKPPSLLIMEAGVDGIGCSAPDKEYIRAVSGQNFDYYSDRVRALMMLNYLGLKVEYRVINNTIGLSGGVRYTRMMTSIGRESYMSENVDYFFINYHQSGLNTEYVRVSEINQNVDYLGFPLEIRLYPKKERKIKWYCKTGVSFNLKVHSKSDIVFFDESMEQYQEDIMKVVENASPFYTTFHLGLGIKIGRSEKPGISIETYTPVGIGFPKGDYFVHPLAGSGFQLLLSVPLNNKEP